MPICFDSDTYALPAIAITQKLTNNDLICEKSTVYDLLVLISKKKEVHIEEYIPVVKSMSDKK